jgi:hypothetical protein
VLRSKHVAPIKHTLTWPRPLSPFHTKPITTFNIKPLKYAWQSPNVTKWHPGENQSAFGNAERVEQYVRTSDDCTVMNTPLCPSTSAFLWIREVGGSNVTSDWHGWQGSFTSSITLVRVLKKLQHFVSFRHIYEVETNALWRPSASVRPLTSISDKTVYRNLKELGMSSLQTALVHGRVSWEQPSDGHGLLKGPNNSLPVLSTYLQQFEWHLAQNVFT